MRFMKLTSGEGEEVYVNFEVVTWVVGKEGKTEIYFLGGKGKNKIEVKEGAEMIMEELRALRA